MCTHTHTHTHIYSTYLWIFTVTLVAQMTVHSVGLLLENAHRLISYVFTGMYTSNKHSVQSTRHDYGSFPDVKQYYYVICTNVAYISYTFCRNSAGIL